MTNIIWLILIISGIIISLFTGEINNLGNIILTSTSDAFSLFFKMALLILFWNGLFNILKDSGFLKRLSKFLSRFLRFIFPEVDKNSLALEYICLTLISNFLGLGIASTSSGLKAFKLLKEEVKTKTLPSKSMIKFIVLNISSLTIFPTSIISIRSAYLGNNPFWLFLLIFCSTLFGSVVSIILTTIFTKGD